MISAIGRVVLPWMSASQPLWMNLLLMSAIVVPVVLATGALLFVAVERPFMGRLGRGAVHPRLAGDMLHAQAGPNPPTVVKSPNLHT